jgi:hypothetical protein
MAGWNTPARNAAIIKKPCDQKAQWALATVGRDNIGREAVARPACTEAACSRHSWMSSAGKMSHSTHFVGTADLPQTVCPSLKRRLTLDITARVTRIGRAEPQTGRASRGPS